MRARSSMIPLMSLGLVLVALLAACDPDATAEPDCPSASAGAVACNSPVVTPSLDAGVLATTGDAAATNDAAATIGSDAGLTTSGGTIDAGSGGMTGGPRPAGDASQSAATDADADASGTDARSGDAQTDASARDGGTSDASADASTPTPVAGFVGEHGPLRVRGNSVVDQHGKPIQLRGMSWFWSQWSDFYVAKNVDVLVDDWKATLVRAALGVENEGGYLVNPQANVAKVRAIVDRAIERGVYVIIDWHDHHAQDHATQATTFFQEMVKAYGKQPHVIFEIYNEPMNVSWSTVKAYAEQMIRTIRASGSNNLIIVGTPNWSQDVDVAASDRITSDDNVAYTLHFYANTHKQDLRDKAQTALDRGIALFVTEWGTCSADGNGSINEGETRTWLSFLRSHAIGWANWALNNKAEACSAVQPSGPSTGPWRNDQLTPSGVLVKSAIP